MTIALTVIADGTASCTQNGSSVRILMRREACSRESFFSASSIGYGPRTTGVMVPYRVSTKYIIQRV